MSDTIKRIVAIDIGGTKVASALVTLGGEEPVIEHYGKRPTEASLGGAHVLEVVKESATRGSTTCMPTRSVRPAGVAAAARRAAS